MKNIRIMYDNSVQEVSAEQMRLAVMWGKRLKLDGIDGYLYGGNFYVPFREQARE